MVNVPDYVENEQAYIDAAHRRIAANAYKTRTKKHQDRLKNEPEYAAVIRFINAKAEKGSKFFVKMQDAIDEYGALSGGQEAACVKIMREDAEKKAEIRKRDAGSEFVGEIGKRETFMVTVTGYTLLEGFYGDQHLHFLKDCAGNVMVYKGSNKIAEKGDVITVKATVKKQEERDGVKQTTIARPAVEKNHGTPAEQGKQAYRDAAGMSSNPYHWEDARHTAWNKGFEDEMHLEMYPA